MARSRQLPGPEIRVYTSVVYSHGIYGTHT